MAEIEASISKAFNRALVKVEASILNFQNRLKELSLDVERLHDFLPSVQKVLSALDDKGVCFDTPSLQSLTLSSSCCLLKSVILAPTFSSLKGTWYYYFADIF